MDSDGTKSVTYKVKNIYADQDTYVDPSALYQMFHICWKQQEIVGQILMFIPRDASYGYVYVHYNDIIHV